MIKHHYGPNVHIFSDALVNSLLTKLCMPSTQQPMISKLVKMLYVEMLNQVIAREFPKKTVKVPTRMTEKHKSVLLDSEVIDENQKAVTVDLARAGILPSQICFDILNHTINPENARQDHVYASRLVNEGLQVIGTGLAGSKIGGPVDKAIVLFPDPMGATGGSISTVIRHYKNDVPGKALKYISVNLIVTPEFLSRVSKDHPDLVVYACRLDRGLSKPEILKLTPGEKWSEEKGLDDTQYIVPGAGGVGEILNNSFV